MSPEIMLGTIVCSTLLVVILLFDFLRGRRRRAVVGAVLLLLFLLTLHLTTGFPESSSAIAFGGTFPVGWAIVLMFVGVVFGIVAQYVFARPTSFSFLDFLRPIVVSPLVLLPLIGSLEGSPLEVIQTVSLVLLAFQNGFFWQQVLKDARPTN